MLPNLSMLVATETKRAKAEAELTEDETEDEEDFAIDLIEQIESIKRYYNLGDLTDWGEVVDKAKKESGFEPVGTLAEQIRQLYIFAGVGPMRKRNRVTMNDLGIDPLLLITEQLLHTDTIRLDFGVDAPDKYVSMIAYSLETFIEKEICSVNKRWRAACKVPYLWKKAFEEEKKQLLEAIAKEDVGEAEALNGALERAKASRYGVHIEWSQTIINDIVNKTHASKRRDVKRMLLARNGINIDNVFESPGDFADVPVNTDKNSESYITSVYQIALVQLYGAWHWLTLHMKAWPALTDDDILSLRTDNKYAESLTPKFGPIEAWNTSELTILSHLFDKDNTDAGWQYMPLGLWDVSKVESFEALFKNAKYFNEYLGEWDVSSGISFAEMFMNTGIFNQPLAKWNVSRGVSFDAMFSAATSFNQPLGTWNLNYDASNLKSYDYMFYRAVMFKQDLRKWTIGLNDNATYMFECSGMYYGRLENYPATNPPGTNWANM